jgi:general L-amino acid transport system permease protein
VKRPWRSARYRAIAAQALLLAAVLALAAWFIENTLRNLAGRGIASGFGFLGSTAGFSIIFHLIDYSELSTYGRAFLVGLLNTLLVSAVGIVLATLLGLLIGIARLSDNWLAARLATVYVETFRNLPLLLQIFFWYFAVLSAMPQPRQSHALFGMIFLNNRGLYLPKPLLAADLWPVAGALAAGIAAAVLLWRRARRRGAADRRMGAACLALAVAPAAALAALTHPLTGWSVPHLAGFGFEGGMVLIPEFVGLVLGLSFYTGAYIAENVRSGILAVDKGQREAAEALGLSRGQTLRLVILPQAMRVIVPPVTSHYLSLTKNSSLAAAIGYPELVSVFAGTVLNQTGQAVEVIAITMAVYLAISLAIAGAMNLYNRRVARIGEGP